MVYLQSNSSLLGYEIYKFTSHLETKHIKLNHLDLGRI